MKTRKKVLLGLAVAGALLVPAGAAFAATSGGSSTVPSMTEMHDRMHAGTTVDPSQMMQGADHARMMGSGDTRCDPDTMAAYHQAMHPNTTTPPAPSK